MCVGGVELFAGLGEKGEHRLVPALLVLGLACREPRAILMLREGAPEREPLVGEALEASLGWADGGGRRWDSRHDGTRA